MASVALEPTRSQETSAVKRTKEYRNWLTSYIEKGRSKVHTQVLEITPEFARIMLEHNEDNRNIRPAKLEQIKSDMKAGRFQFNGDTIKFSKDGKLNDGQHRLKAIFETNKSQKLLVVFGVERDSRTTVDIGATRTVGDHMAVQGWPYATTIASVARMCIGYERAEGKGFTRPSEISVGEIIDRASNDQLLQECASYAASNTGKFKNFGSQGVVGFCFYQFSKRRPLEAKTFIEGVRTGANLNEGSPIRLLRDKMMNSPRLTKVQKIEAYIRAWNAWINDEPLKRLSVMSNLPKIEG